jgi:hypothetical protein
MNSDFHIAELAFQAGKISHQRTKGIDRVIHTVCQKQKRRCINSRI